MLLKANLEKPCERINTERLTKMYGEIPPRPIHLSCDTKYADGGFAAGKATISRHNLILDLGEKEITLPFVSVIPKTENPCPVIAFFGQERGIPNKYLPAEEIIDRGYAIFSLCLDEVSENDGNFKGISSHIARSRRRKSSSGKLAVWAYAIMRVVDYACDLEFTDKEKIIVAGHGLCARAVMLAGGLDERISYIIANGVKARPLPFAESRSESYLSVYENPHLYCPSFVKEPFGDEYYTLLSACSTRRILVGVAEDGEYFDPEEEYNTLVSVSEEYYLPKGMTGLSRQNKIPTSRMLIQDGDISYHIRPGTDYFSREDWNIYLDFIDKNRTF